MLQNSVVFTVVGGAEELIAFLCLHVDISSYSVVCVLHGHAQFVIVILYFNFSVR